VTVTSTIVAIDAGQTGTRSVALDGANQVIGRGSAAGVRHLASPGSIPHTARILAQAYEQACPEAADVAAIGISGWSDDPRHIQRLLGAAQTAIPAYRLRLASDAVTAFIGAADDLPGVVVAVGTGTVIVAADGAGRWARVDGNGYLLGDQGSGFWVGREGLMQAMACADGRGGSPMLLARATARYGAAHQMVDAINAHRAPVPRIAEFALDVAHAAADGDAAAIAIWDTAGRLLGCSACAAADRVFAQRSPVRVTATGGLTAAGSLLLEPLTATIQRARPDSVVRTWANGPLDGAVRLGRADEYMTWFPGAVVERVRS